MGRKTVVELQGKAGCVCSLLTALTAVAYRTIAYINSNNLQELWQII